MLSRHCLKTFLGKHRQGRTNKPRRNGTERDIFRKCSVAMLLMDLARTYIHTYILYTETEALLVISKELRLEVSTDKTKYMFWYREQTAGQNDSI